MRALPERELDLDRRWVMRVPPDPYLRFDTNDYSLDPGFVSPARRGPGLPAEGHRDRARHGRAGRQPRAQLCQAPHDHRARARPRAEGAAR